MAKLSSLGIQITPELRQKLNIQALAPDHPFYQQGAHILLRGPLTPPISDESKALVGHDRLTNLQKAPPA